MKPLFSKLQFLKLKIYDIQIIKMAKSMFNASNKLSPFGKPNANKLTILIKFMYSTEEKSNRKTLIKKGTN